MWVQMSEIIAQTDVLCPCCRTRIHLGDDGGMSTAGDVLENMLANTLKGLF